MGAFLKPPKVESVEIEILRPEQEQVVTDGLRGRSLYPIVLTLLATGLRRGEICALRWKDLELMRNDLARLHVEQSLEQTKKGIRAKSPKTKHGRRTITLPDHVAAELRAHWKAQQEQQLALGLGKASDDDLVFATFDGKPRSPNALTKEWSVAAKALGIHVTLHALRHTHASKLIAEGMDVLTISRRLGHGSPTITLGVYGHLFANSDDRAALIMQTAFSKRSP